MRRVIAVALAVIACAAALPASAAGPSLPELSTFGLADYGAVCDGEHDDRVAFEQAAGAAYAAGGGTVLVPAGNCRIRATGRNTYSWVGPGVTVAGTGQAASTLSLDCDDPNGYRELLFLQGDDTGIRDLKLTRAANCYGALVKFREGSHIDLQRVTLDGRAKDFPAVLHGIFLPEDGALRNVTLSRVAVTGTDYGWLQTNTSRTTVDGLTVDHSTFGGNRADDLELNAPSGAIRRVVITDSRFTGSGGFAVGLANVQRAVITRNTFTAYPQEFVHLEDRSADVSVVGNKFSGNFKTGQTAGDWYSFVFVIQNTSRVTVAGNDFKTNDASRAPHIFSAIYVGPGGPYASPTAITVSGNNTTLKPNTRFLWTLGDAQVTSY